VSEKTNKISMKTPLGKPFVEKDGGSLKIGVYRDDKLDGQFSQYLYDNQSKFYRKVSTENYKNGKLHGPQLYFKTEESDDDESGMITYLSGVSNYINGKPHGQFVELDYKRGIVIKNENYKNGKLHGQCYEVWGPPGENDWRRYNTYKNGKKHGKEYNFYSLDQLHPSEVIEYENGILTGEEKHFNLPSTRYPKEVKSSFFPPFNGIEIFQWCSESSNNKNGFKSGMYYTYDYSVIGLMNFGEHLGGRYQNKENPLTFKGPQWRYSSTKYENTWVQRLSLFEYYDDNGDLLFYDIYEYHNQSTQLLTSRRHSKPKNFDQKKWGRGRETFYDFRLPIDPHHSKVRRYYYENGNIKSEISYKYVDYSEQSNKTGHRSVFGKEVGPFTLYYENGDVKEQGIKRDYIEKPYYRDEQFEGEYVSYYENGNIERKGKYNKDGKRIGTWIGESWNEDSGIKYEKDYKNGLLMVSRHYEDDKLKRTLKYKYDKNGNKLEEYWNENNEIHCNKWIHDKNGKVIEFQEYVDGKLKESR
jgi:antitoxin component YwqK of YwqJK toxin-antitoxin module